MKREEQIASILSHYIQVAWNSAGAKWEPENQEEVEQLAKLICDDPRIGRVGDGRCICTASPQWQENSSRRMGYESWYDEFQKNGSRAGLAVLDHRCVQHGSEAQPRLWGRNKGLTLGVNAKEWISLGVTYTVEESGNAKA